MRTAHDLIRQAQQAYARNDLVAAGALLKLALTMNPLDSAATVLYAVVCARTGKRSVAIEYLRNALSREPNLVEAHVALSTLLFSAGRTDEGLSHGQQAISLQPSDPEIRCHVGRDLAKYGRLEDSLDFFRQAIDLNPTSAIYHLDLASATAASGRHLEAAVSWQRLLELDPTSKVGWIGLGRARLALLEFESALVCGQNAMALDEGSPDAHMLLALAFSGMGNTAESERYLRLTLKLNPNQPFAHGLLGWLLQEKGCFAEAEPLLKESLVISPSSGIAYYALNRTHRASEEDRASVSNLQQLADGHNIGLIDRSYMYYALGKAQEDLGEFEASMVNYDAANRAAGAVWFDKLQWDREGYIRSFDQTIEVFTPDLFRDRAIWASESSTPLMVVGMIRSGTTLVEQILSSHPDVAAGGELTYWHDHASQAFDVDSGKFLDENMPSIVLAYLETLKRISSSARFVTDKLPHNYALLGTVHAAFPNARILHVRRNPLDNCLSIYTAPYGRPPVYALYRENIVCAYQQYLRIVAHWRNVLSPDRFLEIDYEDLVANQESVTRQIIEFLGLEWDEACLHHESNPRTVNTPSAWQVRQSIYRTSVTRWRNFEPWLREFAVLQKGAEKSI